jgi:acetyl-CoA carboxylase biotin carboxyl carrier protein
MTFKEMESLLKLINELEMTEFKMKDGEFEIVVRTKQYGNTKVITQVPTPVVQQPIIATPASTAPTVTESTASTKTLESTPAKEEPKKNYIPIKSPIVGTFYRSSGPDKEAFVKVGDKIQPGKVVCIVEAMKLFNEIEAEVGGTIVQVMVEDAQPVEYDTVLFLVEP